jgi:quinoprotein glucose dehydrogenase
MIQTLPGHGNDLARIISPIRQFQRAQILVLTVLAAALASASGPADWPVRAGNEANTRYSSLSQINRENVTTLSLAWTYHTGDSTEGANIECTPVVVAGRMYLTTADGTVAALNAETGQEIWMLKTFEIPKHAQYLEKAHGPRGMNRGVAFWADSARSDIARIFFASQQGWLFSIDANTGILDASFGEGGLVDLRKGLDWDCSKLFYGCSSPGAIFGDSIILGFANGEGGPPNSPGDIRAFDVRTGKQRWTFHTIPRPGEVGYDTWPANAWKERGGANAWGGISVDTEKGIAFAGTGSAAADFMAGDRLGDNLFANCILALDARTGRRIWHFQTVKHDTWDLDIPVPPIMITVKRDGREIPAIAQVSKTGFVYVLDRYMGTPLFPMEERPVAQTDIPGEKSAATQIFPMKPPAFTRQVYSDDDVTDISPEARAFVLEKLKSMRYGAMFSPASAQGTVFFPGLHGGANWAGGSWDPETGILYVAGNNVPYYGQYDGTPVPRVKIDRFRDHDGYPAVKPPWGTLTALDLNRGELVWQVPLGEHPELTAKGVPQTGTENFGGNIVTAGGLVFVAGTKDEMFRAFDKAMGKVLWQYKLNAGGYAQPCTYMVNGKQFVAIAAGGGGKLGTKSGDEFVAFALPNAAAATVATSAEPKPKKVVFLAGTKSHGPGDHEYELGLKLLQKSLETSPNAPKMRTEIYLDGWPEDERVLDDADTIVLYSDGSDRDEMAHPILRGDRLSVLKRHMDRGCGLVSIHYSDFVPSKKAGEHFLDWIGGYFDYENGDTPNKWYSAIENREFDVSPAIGNHPVSFGLKPFTIREEFYFKQRFRENDSRWKPVVAFDSDGSDPAKVVGWAVQRDNGGRGFGFTGGHYFKNYYRDEYRTLLLNAIVWTSGLDVPAEGIQSVVAPEFRIRTLVVTGHNHPAHDWKLTTAALQDVFAKEPRMDLRVVDDPEFLATPEVFDYDVIVQNYVNWDRPGLSEAAQANLVKFVSESKGLSVIHFANGAFRDWPEYLKMVRRVWVDNVSGHDSYGQFRVDIVPIEHEITKGLTSFDTIDELYFSQYGDAPIEVLATAKSVTTGKDEPMAFVYEYGEGRVFQTVLGHAPESIAGAGTAELIRRGTAWAAAQSAVPAAKHYEGK